MDNYIISDKDFKLFADLVYKETGIDLYSGNKKQLIQSRVNKILRIREIATYRAYYELILADKSGHELMEFINLISTNVTHFFREHKHFDFIKTVWFPQYEPKMAEPVQIWCAASSTGQEPYSISITMYECLGDRYPYEIFASDIDTNVLKRAARGIYTSKDIDSLDKAVLRKYFQEGKGKAAGHVKVKSFIQKHVSFGKVNLIEAFTRPTLYDMIFCRNVMIYFDGPTKERIVNRFYDFMKPGAYLMIGHSESLNGLKHDFQYVQPATYRKPL